MSKRNVAELHAFTPLSTPPFAHRRVTLFCFFVFFLLFLFFILFFFVKTHTHTFLRNNIYIRRKKEILQRGNESRLYFYIHLHFEPRSEDGKSPLLFVPKNLSFVDTFRNFLPPRRSQREHGIRPCGKSKTRNWLLYSVFIEILFPNTCFKQKKSATIFTLWNITIPF